MRVMVHLFRLFIYSLFQTYGSISRQTK